MSFSSLWRCLQFKKYYMSKLSCLELTKLRLTSICKQMRLSFIHKMVLVVFHLQKIWACLPFTKQLRSSSIYKELMSSSIHKELRQSSISPKIEVVFHLKKIEVVFHLKKDWGRLPYSKKLRSSSISSWVNLIWMLWFTFKVIFETIPGGCWWW